MPQPVRTFTNPAGESFLVLDNGQRIMLPTAGDAPSVADRWVDVTGDVMSGRLVISPHLGSFDDPSLTITRDLYPMIELEKRGAQVGHGRWRMYLAGNEAEPNPSLSWTLVDSTGATVTAFRMYENGTMTLGADPTAGLHAATKQYVDRNVSDRWDGLLDGPVTLANGSIVTPTNWTDRISRGITRSGGNFTATRDGVYAISYQGAFSAALASGVRGYLDIVGPGPIYYRSSVGDVENYLSVSAVIGMVEGQQFYTRVMQQSGGTLSLNSGANLQAIRISDL